MTTAEEEQNMAIIRRWNDEGWTGKNYEVAHELISPDMLVHGAGGQKVNMGPEGLIELIKTWHAAFPDGYMTIEDHFAEGDIVVIRNTWHGTHTGDFYGVPPSGKFIEITSIGIDRVEDGKVVEGWGELNMLGAMQQMGAIPGPTGGS
jgi:steroid delta-isomerase-like uncharacterized protein